MLKKHPVGNLVSFLKGEIIKLRLKTSSCSPARPLVSSQGENGPNDDVLDSDADPGGTEPLTGQGQYQQRGTSARATLREAPASLHGAPIASGARRRFYFQQLFPALNVLSKISNN